jgi:hypothetical protein
MLSKSLIAASLLALTHETYAGVLERRAITCPDLVGTVAAANAQATATQFCSSYLGIYTRTRTATSTTATVTVYVPFPALPFPAPTRSPLQHCQQGHLCDQH